MPDTRDAIIVIFGSRGCVPAGFCGSRSVNTDLGSKTGQSMIIRASFATTVGLATMGLLEYPQHDHFPIFTKAFEIRETEGKA